MTAMTLKMIGAALTVGSGALCGMLAAGRERMRLTVLDAWIGLIDRIRTEIDLYLRPLDQILSHTSPSLLLGAGAGVHRTTLRGILLAATPYLSKEARQPLEGLLAALGTSYRHEQVKRCEETLMILRREREHLSAELPARLRLCGTLSTCIASGIAILLW